MSLERSSGSLGAIKLGPSSSHHEHQSHSNGGARLSSAWLVSRRLFGGAGRLSPRLVGAFKGFQRLSGARELRQLVSLAVGELGSERAWRRAQRPVAASLWLGAASVKAKV